METFFFPYIVNSNDEVDGRGKEGFENIHNYLQHSYIQQRVFS